MGCKSSKVSQPHQHRPKHIHIELDVREGCTGKDERETTDNPDRAREDISGIITKALEGFLKGYKVHEQAIQRVKLNPTRKLVVKSNNKRFLTPDSTGTFLTHGVLNTKYYLYAAVDRTTKSVVCLYHWEGLDKKIFVTCPYSRNPIDGSIIPCAEIDITKASKESDPVKAVMEELKKIITGDSKWDMHGADNDFTLSAPGGKIFWRDIEGSPGIKLTDNDSIKLTDNGRIKLKLKLVVV